MSEEEYLDEDPLWFKDAVIYEVHVKAFFDTAGDGIGDFKGLTSKLDYLKDLGVTALWLLPFYPSPLKDDGYDIADYFGVHPLYGTIKDFKEFLREAHKRGLRVITELVLNHTSDQHEWFKKSRTSEPGTRWRDFYVWSNTPDKYKDARIIFKDFEQSNWTYDNVAKAYYWHRFYAHQPDLNFDNPLTQKTMFSVVAYWLKMGVDGMRLDAVPYLFEREGTNCENLPETHGFLKQLRSYIDSNFENRMLLAEANQWPSDAAQYFGNADECNMAFHFPLMPRMFMAIQMEDRFPIIDILEQTPKIPDSCQWAVFLRNHDELTLEMVTDEERDYMYRVYARDRQSRLNLGIRRRLAPLLGNDRRKIELMNVLLFTLPGTPVIYYGDEIGMGDNFYLGDRNGVRTPMQWSADLNSGFSKTNPQKLYLPVIIEPRYHYEAINVENQQNDPASLLWWTKRLIQIRKNSKAFGRGEIQFLYPSNSKILAFLRKLGDETVLVTVNLSGRTQSAELDLSSFADSVPMDAFGGSSLPVIGKSLYRLTFTPYGYYVFNVANPKADEQTQRPREIPQVVVSKKIQSLFTGRPKDKLENEVLQPYLRANRWFSGKEKTVDQIRLREVVPFQENIAVGNAQFLVLVDVYYKEGLPDTYVLPLSYSRADLTEMLKDQHAEAIVCKVSIDKSPPGLLYDALLDENFRSSLLRFLMTNGIAKGLQGNVVGYTSMRNGIAGDELSSIKSRLPRLEQSNTSVVYGDKYILKLVRRFEEGPNPEIEIGEVLTEGNFEAAPKVFGAISYGSASSLPATIAILEQYVRNEGDAWSMFQAEFERFIEMVKTKKPSPDFAFSGSVLQLAEKSVPEPLADIIGHAFLDRVPLLGQRTGEFHLFMLNEKDDPNFKPEGFGYLEQVAIAQSMNSYSNRVFQQCKTATNIPEPARKEIERILFRQNDIAAVFAELKKVKIDSVRTRVHGDYHLQQVLFTGKDFVLIDFEGEPARSLSDRRLKRSPIKDVAGMVRSIHYVAFSTLLKTPYEKNQADREYLETWASLWYKVVASTFLKSYLITVASTPILPSDKKALAVLLDSFLLEKAIYELGYELNYRPSWIYVPILGIEDLLGMNEAPISLPAPQNVAST
jgi:maltose alpha-D-glucosyltransferase / alpha-amylase